MPTPRPCGSGATSGWRRGAVIAAVGRSGSVACPQLHFELRRDAQAVGPVRGGRGPAAGVRRPAPRTGCAPGRRAGRRAEPPGAGRRLSRPACRTERMVRRWRRPSRASQSMDWPGDRPEQRRADRRQDRDLAFWAMSASPGNTRVTVRVAPVSVRYSTVEPIRTTSGAISPRRRSRRGRARRRVPRRRPAGAAGRRGQTLQPLVVALGDDDGLPSGSPSRAFHDRDLTRIGRRPAWDAAKAGFVFIVIWPVF